MEKVRQLVPCGSMMYAVGTFTAIKQGSTVYTRNNIFAFQATAPFNVKSWNPDVNGVVNSIAFKGTNCGNAYIGGQFMAVGTVEYSIPLLANDVVRLVTFSDFGTVDNGITFGAFRASVGAGFRIQLPMMGPVPLAFDFAVPVVRQQTDITQVFSFYVGLTR